ncbi:lipopolysaccharide heptosyltransferase I [Geobacter pelophilus]|uniref:Lipopolysaccharide heptosyltransferase 1 n=1 Tax=Geoanaerobacter pelophilus TaxID=60036 RepID=A0AAW4L5W6_9BACT|nr:lipopolysaccharide heptosyltransferase I [Geoanaerobacter pelophilus]MBT0665567.1 lipopolysaccharide heptosyltransferase I [Geoanaerobacter pelophilus]
MRILIVKMSALGDVIHALPVLDYLHQVRPGIEIGWVVEERFRELLEGNPLVAHLHLIRTREWKKRPLSRQTWKEASRLREEIVACGYDIVFDLQTNTKSGIVAWLSGAPRRVGVAPDQAREPLNRYFMTSSVNIRRQDYHVTDRCLRIVSTAFGRDYAGMQLSTDIHTGSAEEGEAEAYLATLGDGFAVLIHPGTTWGTKLWHEDGWVELGQRILAEFPDSSILLSSAGNAERAMVETIAARVGGQSRVLPAMSLKRLAAVMRKVDLVVGCDSGPVHMAAAVGTPTLSLYRATDGKRTGPRGESHITVQSPLPCTDCLNKQCDNDQECRSSIAVGTMIEGVRKLLHKTTDDGQL